MAKKKITVEITGARNDVLWYRNKTGQRFIVFEENSKRETYSVKMEGHVSRIIYKDDAKVVKVW